MSRSGLADQQPMLSNILSRSDFQTLAVLFIAFAAVLVLVLSAAEFALVAA